MLNKIIEKKAVLIYRRKNDSNKPIVEHYNTFSEAREAAINKGIMHNDDLEFTLARYTKLFNRWILCKDGYSNDPFGEFTVGLYA